MQKPSGKGLTGFIFGLLLATLIIGAVLFFLNYAPSGFRQPDPPPEVQAKPEELVPRGSQVRQPPQEQPASGSLADPWGDVSETDTPQASAPLPAPPKTEEERKPEPPPVPKTDASEKPRQPAESKQTREPRPDPKPTPEQILDSGSVEKAREQVRREQQGKQAENRAAQNTGGKVVVQMGSFNNAEAADAQRAKLAMLGVNARLSRATGANGQTVYRIQSGRLSREEAQRLSEKLRQNNIDSLTRNAE